MKPEYQEAIEQIDADRKRWMKTELMVDCQITGDMAETLVDEYFGKREPAPAFWIAKSRFEKVMSGEIGWPHVYTTDQSEHFECVPLFISASTPSPVSHLRGEIVAWRWSFDGGQTWSHGPENPGNFRFGEPDRIEPLCLALEDRP